MYASSVAFFQVYRLGLTARFQAALNEHNVSCEDIGSVDFVTCCDFMLMLFICSENAGRLLITDLRV